MENQQQTSAISKEIENYLNMLQNSPIVGEEYYLATKNLCEVIVMLAQDASEILNQIDDATKENEIWVNILTESIQDRLSQIETVSIVIEERVNHDDYLNLTKLLYHYHTEKNVNS